MAKASRRQRREQVQKVITIVRARGRADEVEVIREPEPRQLKPKLVPVQETRPVIRPKPVEITHRRPRIS